MLSIVVPVYNEEESLPHFYAELSEALNGLDEKSEVIFIDDGSTDASLTTLKDLEKKDSRIRVFSFRTNQGKSEALMLGFQKAKGEYIVTLDSDLQDKPSELPRFLEKAKEGVEVVCGWKKNRKDSSKMVIISHLFNSLVGKLFDLHLHDYNCGYKLYTKEAANSLRLYGGLYRFIPLLAYEQGFVVEEIPVDHQKRKFGKSKYGFSKLWKDLPDMFTMLFLVKYGKRPLHFFGVIGSIFTLFGFLILSYFTFIHYAFNESVGRRPFFLMGMLFVMVGLQVFFTGFLADLMINIAHTPRLLDEGKAHFKLKYSSESDK